MWFLRASLPWTKALPGTSPQPLQLPPQIAGRRDGFGLERPVDQSGMFFFGEWNYVGEVVYDQKFDSVSWLKLVEFDYVLV